MTTPDNSMDRPAAGQLPSPQRLRRSAVIAVVLAIVIGVCVVLPAELGVDPTGVGQLVGLKEMGEFKVEAARELAEAAAKRKAVADSIALRDGGSPIRPY
jgi:hypothetical protein